MAYAKKKKRKEIKFKKRIKMFIFVSFLMYYLCEKCYEPIIV